jgi:hypothetical protein
VFIFLDIDGVLVPARSWEKPVLLSDAFPTFSINAVQALRSLIKENTQIILTTSHRFRFTIQEWKSIFRNRGVEVVSIEKLPESDSYNTNRKEDILRWLAQRPSIDNYIILDDDKSLNDLPSEVKNKLILTQSTVGLTEADVSSFL